jgi:hypothetical protein
MVQLQSKAYQKSRFMCLSKEKTITEAFNAAKEAAAKCRKDAAEGMEQAKAAEKVSLAFHIYMIHGEI